MRREEPQGAGIPAVGKKLRVRSWEETAEEVEEEGTAKEVTTPRVRKRRVRQREGQ
jgi:hypothetical protein